MRVRPGCRIVRFNMGDRSTFFPMVVSLISKNNVQIRDIAIESARQTSNRALEKSLGKSGYHFRIRIYPHHVLRENPLASGAGADRMSTGMKCSFGKPIGIAAQVKKGQTIFQIETNKEHLALARIALRKAAQKLPTSCSLLIEERPIAVV